MRQIGRELSGPHSSPLLLAFTNKTLEILKYKSKGGRPRPCFISSNTLYKERY